MTGCFPVWCACTNTQLVHIHIHTQTHECTFQVENGVAQHHVYIWRPMHLYIGTYCKSGKFKLIGLHGSGKWVRDVMVHCKSVMVHCSNVMADVRVDLLM